MKTIEEFVEKYRDFFLATEFDVAHTIKNRWYVFTYNKQYKYYDMFTEFNTIPELIHIITTELAFLMSCGLEYETDVPVFERGITDILENYSENSKDYEELLYNIRKIVNSELGNIGLFKYLDKFVQEQKDLEENHE